MRARQACDRLDDVAHIGELRKGFCGQERADLEMPDARGIFLADPTLFCLRRGKRPHKLQSVAEAHFAERDTAIRIDLLNAGHARLPAVLVVGVSFSISARTAAVSAPSGATFRPSPRLAPFHSIGSAGTRKAAPSALTLLTRPPGRSTCGSSNKSSGRLIGEKQMLSASSFAERPAPPHRLISPAPRGMIRPRPKIRSVVGRRLGSSRNSRRENSPQKLCQWP